jgi:hypothetical protein
MDRFRGKHFLVERSSNGTGKHVRFLKTVSIWVSRQDFKQRVEVVRRLINVKYQNRPIFAYALSQASYGELHQGQ